MGEIQKDDQKLTSQRPGKVTSNSSPATPSDKDQSVNEKLLSNGRQNSGKKRQPDVLDESGRKLSLAIQCSIAGCVELGVLSPDFNQQDVTVRKWEVEGSRWAGRIYFKCGFCNCCCYEA